MRTTFRGYPRRAAPSQEIGTAGNVQPLYCVANFPPNNGYLEHWYLILAHSKKASFWGNRSPEVDSTAQARRQSGNRTSQSRASFDYQNPI